MEEKIREIEKISHKDRREAKRLLVRLLAKANDNPPLGCEYGERIAALDINLFKSRRIGCPQAVFLSSFMLFSSYLVILGLHMLSLPSFFQLICLSSSFFCLWFFSHDLAHFLVGTMLGMRFPFFYSGKSDLRRVFRKIPLINRATARIPALGLKIDYSNFFCLSKKRRVAMFCSGSVASMTMPIFVMATAWQIEIEAWVRLLVCAMVIGNIIFTIPASYFHGDFLKARSQR